MKEIVPKTPMTVAQELMALVSQKRDKQPQSMEDIITKLQDEISLYGDNVASTVDRSDPYFESKAHDEKLFRQAIQRLKESAGELPKTLEEIFAQLQA